MISRYNSYTISKETVENCKRRSVLKKGFTDCVNTVLATAKLTSFSFLVKNEDAYFRERKRIFQRTKTHISENENAKKRKRKKNENAKKRKRKKTKTHKNEDAKERISIGALYKSLQIINSSFIYKEYLDCL